jgi:carbon starvation protein
VPTSRFVLYGYHFKSIAAAGPIVGVITAANIWGWLPAIIWLMVGVTFIGWASDYSAIMMAVRNDGNSLSAVAHRLVSPRTRTILFVFIFFYLLLIGGAFLGIMAAILDARPDVVFGIVVLGAMGMLGGWLIYRRRMDLILVTLLVVGVTLAAMAVGPLGVTFRPPAEGGPTWDTGVVSGPVRSINTALNGGGPIYTVVDPTNADPRIPPPNPDTGERPATANYDPATGAINVFPSFLFWCIFLLAFSYLGTNLAIWRFAQPVNYIGFWVTALVIVVSAIGAVLAPFTNPELAAFKLDGFKGFAPEQATGAIQTLWPMLFVTIACGAISGWHALFGSVGTARQLEYETDALPVGGGGMFSENTLGLLSLTAVAITVGLAGAGAFAAGVGNLISTATFGLIPVAFGTALGFGAFVVIVLTVVQLVFRVMRVTLGEWLGDWWVGFKNQHVASITGSVLVLALVLSGTWVYLWQLFGASNQLLAALSLLLVTLWLVSTRRNPAYAGIPMLFMYVTTVAASLVTAYNLYATIVLSEGSALISVIGAWAMIAVSLLLVGAALLIGWDAWRAWNRYRTAPPPVEAAAAPTS